MHERTQQQQSVGPIAEHMTPVFSKNEGTSDNNEHRHGDQEEKADQWDQGNRLRAVDQGPGGRLFILEDGGRLLELLPR